MEISNIDNKSFKNNTLKAQDNKLDVSFRDVMGDKLSKNFDATKVMPADVLNHSKLQSKKKTKSLLEVQVESLDNDEESPLKTINELKKTMKKLVAIERQFLGL